MAFQDPRLSSMSVPEQCQSHETMSAALLAGKCAAAVQTGCPSLPVVQCTKHRIRSPQMQAVCPDLCCSLAMAEQPHECCQFLVAWRAILNVECCRLAMVLLLHSLKLKLCSEFLAKTARQYTTQAGWSSLIHQVALTNACVQVAMRNSCVLCQTVWTENSDPL